MPVKLNNNASSTGQLSLTPLIDVVFLLVIFFLVTSRFEQEERDIDVTLPQASEAEPTIFDGEEIRVAVTPEGEIFANGERHTVASFEAMLAERYRSNPGRQRVTIRADQESRAGRLVALMNACNRAGVTNYRLATE